MEQCSNLPIIVFEKKWRNAFIFCYDEVLCVQQERWISTSCLTYLKNIDNAIQDFSSKLIWHGMKSKWSFLLYSEL